MCSSKERTRRGRIEQEPRDRHHNLGGRRGDRRRRMLGPQISEQQEEASPGEEDRSIQCRVQGDGGIFCPRAEGRPGLRLTEFIFAPPRSIKQGFVRKLFKESRVEDFILRCRWFNYRAERNHCREMLSRANLHFN